MDFEGLLAVNDDIIGWIYIENTDISYPVLCGRDNQQYLFQSYEKKYLTAGSIYIDYRCSRDFTDSRTVIYGHNMHNGSMFGKLDKFTKESYMKEHPYVYILLPSGETLKYEPGKAAIILQNLPEEMQPEVSKRLATMDRTSPDVLREVERVLEKKLSTLSSEDYTAAGGVESVVEILNLVDRSSEKAIIESLEEEDPDLAEEIKKRMFVFEDIVMLDDRAIQKVLRDVDTQELSKALKSVDAEVQDKIFKNMSKRAAAMLKEDMEFMGPVRLKDVEEAQQRIVSTIRRLEDSGDIVIARAGEDELVQ